MLVLTRKIGETIQIGDDIVIKITDVSGDKVRVGIDAPESLKILRGELVEIIAQNLEAAKSPTPDALKKFLGNKEKKPKP